MCLTAAHSAVKTCIEFLSGVYEAINVIPRCHRIKGKEEKFLGMTLANPSDGRSIVFGKSIPSFRHRVAHAARQSELEGDRGHVGRGKAGLPPKNHSGHLDRQDRAEIDEIVWLLPGCLDEIRHEAGPCEEKVLRLMARYVYVGIVAKDRRGVQFIDQ